MYKKMKNNQTKNKQYKAQHKNRESTEVPYMKLKQSIKTGNDILLNSTEYKQKTI